MASSFFASGSGADDLDDVDPDDEPFEDEDETDGCLRLAMMVVRGKGLRSGSHDPGNQQTRRVVASITCMTLCFLPKSSTLFRTTNSCFIFGLFFCLLQLYMSWLELNVVSVMISSNEAAE